MDWPIYVVTFPSDKGRATEFCAFALLEKPHLAARLYQIKPTLHGGIALCNEGFSVPAFFCIAFTLLPEAQSFNRFYAVQERGHTLKAIFRETLGMSDFPAEIAPYSFISRDDLARIADLLALQAGQSLADVACGNGSLGLWLAQLFNAQVIGVDYAPAALTLAREKAEALDLTARSRFVLGSFTDTTLPAQSVDAVVAFDALWLASDQAQALAEIARILRPGGRFVLTSWEQHIPMAMIKQPVADYRPLLTDAGFAVESYDYLTHSEALMKTIYERIRQAARTLLQEMGEPVKGLIGEANFVPGLVDGVNYLAQEHGPQVLVAARRL